MLGLFKSNFDKIVLSFKLITRMESLKRKGLILSEPESWKLDSEFKLEYENLLLSFTDRLTVHGV